MHSITRFVPTVARIALGLIFVVFGLNGFLGFLPHPEMPASANAFVGALATTGYMFPLIKGTEVLAGLALLGNRFVPLALVLLAPIVVNIVLFHALLAPGGLGIALAVLALELGLAYAHRDAFRSVLVARASQPARAAERDHAQPAHA